MAKKRCRAGTHKSASGKSCVSNKGGSTRGSKKCPTMKQLGRQWKGMGVGAKKSYPKRGNSSSWNQFVKKKRSGCAS